jgi:hypothetical protein
MHPIAQRLAIHAADQSRRLPAHAVAHACQGEQAAARLASLLRAASRRNSTAL